MESKKREEVNANRNIKVKELPFNNMPDGSSQWIVVACGKIINGTDGNYKQEIILKKYVEGESPSITWNLKDDNKIAYVNVDLGRIRVFTPGTIIQNKHIVKFAPEYLTKVDLIIDNPQSLEKKPLRILYDHVFPEFERSLNNRSSDPIETRVLNHSGFGRVMIPCTVIADYYYYGKNVHLTKAILEGAISRKFANSNNVYNPRKYIRGVSPLGKVIVSVELQRKMDFRDEFKIARLADDTFFYDKCLDIYNRILNGSSNGTYIETDLPINQPTILSVYGVKTNVMGNNFFLVHSISKCTAKPTFDLIIATKRFRGRADFDGLPSGGGGNDKDGIGLAPKNPPKPRTRRKLKKPDSKIVGDDKPQWDAMDENIEFDNDQSDNFPNNAAVNDRDFLDPEKQKEAIETLIKYGFAPQMSTNPNRTGSSLTLPLTVSATRLTKPPSVAPTKAFEFIENVVALLVHQFLKQEYKITSNIICPVPEGDDKYSAFPVSELRKEPNIDKRKKYLFFCYQYVQLMKHEHHRRIFIYEIIINGQYFYIMDIEPKYKVKDSDNNVVRLVSSAGVIFYAGNSSISQHTFRDILKRIVTTYQTKEGRWKFLSPDYSYEIIRHGNIKSTFVSVQKFVNKQLYSPK